MKSIGEIGAQGDILFVAERDLPDAAVLENETNRQIVGHSETGHHHVAMAGDVGMRWYKNPRNSMEHWLEIFEDVQVIHQRDFHTHETVLLEGPANDETSRGESVVFRIIQQQEFRPEGWAKVND